MSDKKQFKMDNVKEVKRSPLTHTQQEYYDFITLYVENSNGLFPTIQEIAKGAKKTHGGTQMALLYLSEKGYIERVGDDKQPRCYRLSPPPGLPSLARAAAYKVLEPQIVSNTTVPKGAFVLKKDNDFIGYWIPAECIGGSVDGAD
jgi:SOS-response transcriptional repressor LexA